MTAFDVGFIELLSIECDRMFVNMDFFSLLWPCLAIANSGNIFPHFAHESFQENAELCPAEIAKAPLWIKFIGILWPMASLLISSKHIEYLVC